MKLSRFLIRPAKITDSDNIARLQRNYFNFYPSNFRLPKSSKRIRREIGSSLLLKHNSKYLVGEIDSQMVGFIEMSIDKEQRIALISIPYIDMELENYIEYQRELLEFTLQNLKDMKIKRVQAEISLEYTPLVKILHQFKFKEKKTIFEVWEGRINPEASFIDNELSIRKIQPSDAKISYQWIQDQLDPESPLYISYEAYRKFFNAPKESLEGWAVAERDGFPAAIISSFPDQEDTIVVFGPFCSEKNQDLRIPLFNELLWMYHLRGHTQVRVMRIKSIMNDEHLFDTFGLDLSYLVHLYERKL